MNDISNTTLLEIVSLLSYIVLVKLFELSRYCNKVTSEGVHNPHEYYVSCIMPIPYWTIHFRPWYTYPPCRSDYFTCWITIVVHTDNKNHMLLILLKSNVLDNSWEPKMSVIVWHAVMSCCYISQMLVCPWDILNYGLECPGVSWSRVPGRETTAVPKPVTRAWSQNISCS